MDASYVFWGIHSIKEIKKILRQYICKKNIMWQYFCETYPKFQYFCKSSYIN
ncbi:hypothetical protein CsatB_025639 [Cannabis sativa]